MVATIVENSIEVPDGVSLNLEGRKVTVVGEKGEVVRDFSHALLEMGLEDGALKIWR